MKKNIIVLSLLILLIIAYGIFRYISIVSLYKWYIGKTIIIIEVLILIILFYLQNIIKKNNKSIIIFIIVLWLLPGVENCILERTIYRYNNVKTAYGITENKNDSIIWYENDNYALVINKKTNMVESFYKDGKGWKVGFITEQYSYFSSYDNNDFSIKFYYINEKYFQYVEVKNKTEIDLFKDNTDNNFKKMKTNFKVKDNFEYYGKEIDDYKKYKLYYNDKEIEFQEESNATKTVLGIPQ